MRRQASSHAGWQVTHACGNRSHEPGALRHMSSHQRFPRSCKTSTARIHECLRLRWIALFSYGSRRTLILYATPLHAASLLPQVPAVLSMLSCITTECCCPWLLGNSWENASMCTCAVDVHHQQLEPNVLLARLQSLDQRCQENVWRHLVNESTKRACEVHASQQASEASLSETMEEQDILLQTRATWSACTPLWVSIARSLLVYGPQQSFEVCCSANHWDALQ